MPSSQTKLVRVDIGGFKSIRDAALELRPLNLLIGANGAGKSNLVTVFTLLNQIVEGRLESWVTKVGGADKLLHNGPKHTQQIRLRLQFSENEYEAQLEWAQDESLFFAKETCDSRSHDSGAGQFLPLGEGHKESRLPDTAKSNPVAKSVLDILRSCIVYHFHDTSPDSAVKRKGPVDDNVRLRSDAGNLAAFLLRLQETDADSCRRIVGAVRQVAPFFDRFDLKPDRLRPDHIQIEWIERDSDTYFNGHSLSDGTLRFICLATLLLQPDLPSLILIDEPELGLHPYAVTLLAALLKSAATRTQLLVATQSVTLMNQFDPEDVVVVDRKDGQSTFERLTAERIESWTDGYAMGELWEKNIIGGRPQR